MAVGDRRSFRFRQVSASLEGKVDARRPADSKATSPFDDRLRTDHAGGMEKIDVARSAERVAEIDRTVSDSVLSVDETTKTVGLIEISAAVIACIGIDPPALEE